MPRSSIGFIARSLSLATASVATLAIASAAQHEVDTAHQANPRPSTYQALRAGSDAGTRSGEMRAQIDSRDGDGALPVDRAAGGIALLAGDIGNSERLTVAAGDVRRTTEEASPAESNHPLGLTSILATLALVAFYFLRRLV